MSVHDASGALAQSCCYQGGQVHGVMKVFEKGRCVSQQQYLNGRLHGPSITFDEAGQPLARLQFSEGVLEGPSEFFHEGQRVRLAHYHRGVLEGESTDFTRDGTAVQTCTYRANRLHGPLRRYWPNGELMQETHYRVGVPYGASIQRDAQGRDIEATAGKPTWIERVRFWVRGG
jgi:antitoxin component YwqK of YwqJK toxin-antitoxin module